MKKIFFLAALVFTTSVLTTLINNANTAQPTSTNKIISLVSGERNLLATAD